jgi:hypothetical protein
MMNVQFSAMQTALPNHAGILDLLEAQTNIQFHLPEGGPSFGPSILDKLDAATDIQFRTSVLKPGESTAVVESMTKLLSLATYRPTAACAA